MDKYDFSKLKRKNAVCAENRGDTNESYRNKA